ncbi:MAG: DUF4147 domain-containing protein [Clostridia bacterium]|nr:DUF4147 domain-containing protein [Clostridia bacterium]
MERENRLISDAMQIVRTSIAQVLPDEAVRRTLSGVQFSRPVTLIALGKAAWRMADAAYRTLGKQQIRQGVVITKYGHCEGEIGCLELYEAGHPVPDENGVRAAQRVLEMVRGLGEGDEVVLLISGGGSALFESPAPDVTLEDIADATRQLLACGADITQINCIRKRLSAVKGGRLALEIAPAKTMAIVLSDVLGDPLDAIASGPAYPDETTCEKAMEIVRQYGLTLSDAAMAAMGRETPKMLSGVKTVIAGNVQALCAAAAREAQRLGYSAQIVEEGLCCEARDAGLMLAERIRTEKGPCALIWGGETVVHVRGTGKGGRNQEAALAAALGIAGMDDVCVFAVGSDGTDGPTDAAGGIVTGAFAQRAGMESIRAHLENNDAYTLLSAMDALIMTGPTGTNVNDLYVALKR